MVEWTPYSWGRVEAADRFRPLSRVAARLGDYDWGTGPVLTGIFYGYAPRNNRYSLHIGFQAGTGRGVPNVRWRWQGDTQWRGEQVWNGIRPVATFDLFFLDVGEPPGERFVEVQASIWHDYRDAPVRTFPVPRYN